MREETFMAKLETEMGDDESGRAFRGIKAQLDDEPRKKVIERLLKTIEHIGEVNEDIKTKVQAAVEKTSIEFVKSVMRTNAGEINNRIKDLIKEDLEKISQEMKRHVDHQVGLLRKDINDRVEGLKKDMWNRLGDL